MSIDPVPPYWETLPEWPSFDLGDKDIDGLVPVTRVTCWKGYQEALSEDFFNRPGAELIYRGHRRHDWQLTPTLGRYAESGVIQPKQAQVQLDEFRYAMRGRGASFSKDDEEIELWAYGQHHGLATPLLDWTKSPFVALFFAFADDDPVHEQPNSSRPIFILNHTALSALDENLIVQPMRSDHTRLINQAGLFTISPLGEKTLITHVMDLLADAKIDMDDPAKVSEYICKIHIPYKSEERIECMRALRMMNLHHGTLFPDPIGASRYCNDWYGSQPVPSNVHPVPIEENDRPVRPRPEKTIEDYEPTVTTRYTDVKSRSRRYASDKAKPQIVTHRTWAGECDGCHEEYSVTINRYDTVARCPLCFYAKPLKEQ